MATVSALLSAYRGTPADELRTALDSLLAQTRPADEIVLVFDGPVSDEVASTVRGYGDAVRVVALERNGGLGPALQAGLESIDSDYVLRLDTDDAAYPQRLEKQLEFMEAHPEVAALGSAVTEFQHEAELGDPAALRVRALPEHHAELARYALINSPLNHPSVMLRTADVTAAGGYRGVHFMEDYDLWARLIAAGYALHNLPEPLTHFRVSPAQFARRTGRGMFAAERQMQANLVRYGLIGPWRSRANLAVRTAYRLLPTAVLTRVYAKLFHRAG
ncbi:glycosyltransferase [Corynebacterium auris]|uniref:glycosyltransferase n=1 Tax=Corynebacterium auris TaxID=44750 RepID=UPI0025B541FF|nr:glycosyltransferase [Corynebacterium auris]WJY67174.1 UDP-Gal:alpha-D-GlcNAc-diphosphoundecaprenol beta-1,3-galactosyltransferase [Corynebacterium auris]